MNDTTTRLKPSYLKGLTDIEVKHQENRGLGNPPPPKITKSNWRIIKDNVVTLFNLYNFLIGIALISVGAYSNLAYLLIILINISIGIAQEIHSKNLVENLSLLATPKADVMRSGHQQEIMIEDLVQDDVIIFDLGKQVCVDSIVLHGTIEVNESLLTGEADPILKKVGDLLLSGSFVVSGKCYAQVENVGVENYAMQITHEAQGHKVAFSELLTSMRRVTNFTSFLIIPLGILLFLEAYFLRQDSMQMSVVATAAALLGMLPKGLMLLISISLATGVIKLAKKQILVQELFALESLAHVDILCVDKTGTLTEGKMTVSEVNLLSDQLDMPQFKEQMQQFLAAMDDNNATFTALLDYFKPQQQQDAVNIIPFSSERKWSSASFSEQESIILGAPERLLDAEIPLVQQRITEGARVLVIARCHQAIISPTLPEQIEPLAMITLVDPIRANAAQTLAFFRQEKVAIKIISGDNPMAVSAIAKEAGFVDYSSYVDMSTITEADAVMKAAKRYDIFGRVSPQQKQLIIRSLKQDGHTVGMTGDGVNDVLALKEADCSIAMAEGSDATRQIAQLVLLNSDFGVLPHVVMEGRRVVNNITKLASVFFIKTVYSVLLSLVCLLVGLPFPFIPIQITLIDLAIEGYPSFFMSFESNSSRIRGRFLPNVLKRAIPHGIAIILGIIILGMLSWALQIPAIQSVTMMYYLIAFISIWALVKVSYPFNQLRIFLCASVFVGFYACAMLFAKILHIELLSVTNFIYLMVVAVLCVISERMIAHKMKQEIEKRNLNVERSVS